MSKVANDRSYHEGSYPEGVSSRFVGITAKGLAGSHGCQGLYWTVTDTAPSIAYFLVHYNGDFSEHYMAAPLAALGYGVLGFNTRFRGNEDAFILEQALEDIAAGMKWLRDIGGAKKIVFIGNSGGGSLGAAYQATAQKTPTWVPADGFIFFNAHPGRPNVLTTWLDPSVIDENDPTKTDPSLDMYNPENKVPYSQDFIARYRAAQVERNNKITRWARAELKRLNAAGIPDRIFPLYRTMADLRFNDATIDPSKRPVPGCYVGDPEKANRSISLLGRTSTLRTWLSMWSLEESQCKMELYSTEFQLPTLVLQTDSDAGVFPSDARTIYEAVSAKDKELKMIPGDHFFRDEPEKLSNALHVIQEWVNKRF